MSSTPGTDSPAASSTPPQTPSTTSSPISSSNGFLAQLAASLPPKSTAPRPPLPLVSSLPSSSPPQRSSASSSSSPLSPPLPRAKRLRTMPPPPVLPPSATGDDLINVPYDSMAEQPFKNAAYMQKMKAFTGARYRPAKLIVNAEQYHKYPPNVPAYPHLRASASQYPRKRYCDVTHLPATYTDPSTRLHFCDSFRFAIIRSLSREQVNARLALRKAQLSEIK